MAYGQTGAGKTFTMTGDTGNYRLRGIIPRAISQVIIPLCVYVFICICVYIVCVYVCEHVLCVYIVYHHWPMVIGISRSQH